jgi:hypothetical protein
MDGQIVHFGVALSPLADALPAPLLFSGNLALYKAIDSEDFYEFIVLLPKVAWPPSFHHRSRHLSSDDREKTNLNVALPAFGGTDAAAYGHLWERPSVRRSRLEAAPLGQSRLARLGFAKSSPADFKGFPHMTLPDIRLNACLLPQSLRPGLPKAPAHSSMETNPGLLQSPNFPGHTLFAPRTP